MRWSGRRRRQDSRSQLVPAGTSHTVTSVSARDYLSLPVTTTNRYDDHSKLIAISAEAATAAAPTQAPAPQHAGLQLPPKQLPSTLAAPTPPPEASGASTPNANAGEAAAPSVLSVRGAMHSESPLSSPPSNTSNSFAHSGSLRTPAEASLSEGGIEKSTHAFVVGFNVEARWRGRDRWFDAIVVALRPRGCYDLIYADGDEEESVSSTFVRALGGVGSAAASLPSPAAIGTVSAVANLDKHAQQPPGAAAVTAEQEEVLARPPISLASTISPLSSPSTARAQSPGAGGLGGSALQALRDAKAMQDECLISADDFAAMKARILSNM